MRKTSLQWVLSVAVLLAVLLGGVHSQGVVIRNMGCKSSNSKGVCTACAVRYYLDPTNICQPVNPNCNTYDPHNGGCTSCYPGFGLIEDTCLPGIVSSNFDPNCNTFNGSNCAKCSSGFFLRSDGKCAATNPACKTFSSQDGSCLSCFSGYEVAAGNCVAARGQAAVPNCNQIDPLSGSCLKCAYGYYFDQQGRCQQADPNCKTFDALKQKCVGCYAGFELDGSSVCVKAKAAVDDPNCALYDASHVCLQCSKGAIFNSQQQCIVVDPSCLTFSQQTGACLSCYPGYALTPQASCILAENAPNPNAMCAKWRGTVCEQCAKGTFLGRNNICAVANPLCLTFNETNGDCLSCYAGYSLAQGACLVSNATTPTDPYCQKFLTADVCTQCSDRYYIGFDGVCREVNPLCKTYDQSTGNCISCFPGYELAQGACGVATESVADVNCKRWDGKVCKECAFGAFFSRDGSCQFASPLCKTFDPSNGDCTSCYDSFDLAGGACVKSVKTLSDANCAQFLQGICTRCSVGFVFQNNGQCGLVSSDCKTFDQSTGRCLTCYLGFALSQGQCTRSNDTSPIDPNCASFVNGACVRCSKGFYFGSNGACLGVSSLCQTFDPATGSCLTCYPSFILAGGACVEDKNHTSGDANCASWLNGVCTACATRTFMDGNGLCQAVSIDCSTYSSTNGACTSCYPGFALSQGKCALSTTPSSCSKFGPNGECVQCGKGSYLNTGQCVAIDPQCANFDVSALSCVDCYPGYAILNGACQIGKVQGGLQVENCYAYDSLSQCIKCYDRFYLNGNSCAPVNVFCKTFDDHTGNCLSCYSTFSLANGRCQQ